MKQLSWLSWFRLCCLASFWLWPGGPAFGQESLQTPAEPPYEGLIVERTGGFAGGPEEWHFSPRGLRWKPGEEAERVPVDKLTTLVRLVSEKQEPAANRAAETETVACFDCFVFRITVWRTGTRMTLELVEAGTTADRRAQEALRIIRELVRETKTPSSP
ncbi:MAG: hypothetical protein EHM61_04405 [Acidobacteria bacterium]|nr:MAG: hypothetical protein EHM61_04405 [Acidobacteriota bacterium]